jgi:hypothetical protein
MAKRPEPPKPMIWNIFKIAAKVVCLGVIEAPDEAPAIEKGAAEFKVPANRRSWRYDDDPPQRRSHKRKSFSKTSAAPDRWRSY